MPGRTTDRHDIVSRYGVPSDVASPEDLTLAPADGRQGIPPVHLLAYCADFAAERVIFTHHDEPERRQLFGAPFLFVEQLRLASGVTTVPFEHLAELRMARPDMRPTVVFSPGRTGSTLLAKLLAASGQGCASEPDMLTQIGRADPRTWASLPSGMDALLAATCIGALCRMLGPDAVIKLRGWCNARPMAMVGGVPGCRVVFMLRRIDGWALSRHRVFQETAEAVSIELRRALDALDTLAGAGVPVTILWYEDLIADPGAALAMLGACVPADRLAPVMREDSQEGSWIARRVVAARPVEDGFLTAFATHWHRTRRNLSWSAGTEALLRRMWEGRAGDVART